MLTMIFVIFELFALAVIVGIIGWWLEHNPDECTGTHCMLAHTGDNA